MKILFICMSLLLACDKEPDDNGGTGETPKVSVSEQNLTRAIAIADNAVSCYFTGSGMAMSRYYNPYTKVRSEEKGSIWMYTASIEAVSSILNALKAQKERGETKLYDEHFSRYTSLLAQLIDNMDYYLGTFTLISYTQTKQWSVYGVNRGNAKGTAKVEGVENVYDDQQWLVRELIEAWRATGNQAYLDKAEYLTEYVLDGWDCTRRTNGEELGGIPWGPGYVTKHSCSNGPMVSPLVWLHDIYKNKTDMIEHRYIDAADRRTRLSVQEKKSDYYLDFAKKIYAWQKQYLLRSDGVYDDMMGGCSPGSVSTETVNGVVYRRGATCSDRVGPAYSYNSGTMLSGAADLYRATGSSAYLDELKSLADASFKYFAKLGGTLPGYYTYDISGFNNWFNNVLMRGYAEAYSSYNNVSVCVESFQKNLDYAFDNFLYDNFLPTNLLVGWSRENSNNQVEAMFTFTFAAEYAVLSQYELEKEN